MSPVSNSFSVPREQWLTWTHLSVSASRSPLAAACPTAGRHFFFWARNAIFHALRALDVSRGARALLPAYLCRAAAEPFAAHGLLCDFYDLREDCSADFDEIETKILPETRVLLATHYFGFPHAIERFRKLCTSRNLLLFEDCAHVLRTEVAGRMLGTYGDAGFFSYRKFLPMFDGAELLLSGGKQMNWLPEPSRFRSRAAKFIASQAIHSSPSPFARIFVRCIDAARKPGKKGAPTPIVPVATQAIVDNNSASFDPSLVDQPMTEPSRWVLAHSDVPEVIRYRRANFAALHDNLSSVPGVRPLFATLPQGVCPWVYPLFVDGLPNAHLPLRDMGIPAVTWGGVRVEGLSEREFPGAHFLYENLVFLPIHQNLTAQHLEMIVQAVKKVGATARRREPRKMLSVG
jgi:perosamine synthetase